MDPKSVTYHTGGEETPGREEKLKLDLPPDVKVKPIGKTQTLSQMIADGELDAIYAPRLPSTFHTRPNDVKRLFENYMEVERAYYTKTKIFPIMHTIVIKRDLYKANPWVAGSLFKAFAQAQKLTIAKAFDELDAHRVIELILADNGAARRVVERLGFKREGVMRGHVRRGDELLDVVVYGLWPEDFRE